MGLDWLPTAPVEAAVNVLVGVVVLVLSWFALGGD